MVIDLSGLSRFASKFASKFGSNNSLSSSCSDLSSHTEIKNELIIPHPHIFDIKLTGKHSNYGINFIVNHECDNPEIFQGKPMEYSINLGQDKSKLKEDIKQKADIFQSNICSFFTPKELANLIASKILESDLPVDSQFAIITKLSSCSKDLKPITTALFLKIENHTQEY